MKLIKIYGVDTEHYFVNPYQIVQVIKPVLSDHDKTEIHLSNGKIILTNSMPKEIEEMFNES